MLSSLATSCCVCGPGEQVSQVSGCVMSCWRDLVPKYQYQCCKHRDRGIFFSNSGLLCTSCFALLLNFCLLWIFWQGIPASLLIMVTFIYLLSKSFLGLQKQHLKSLTIEPFSGLKTDLSASLLLCISPLCDRWFISSLLSSLLQHVLWLSVLRTLCKALVGSAWCTSLL